MCENIPALIAEARSGNFEDRAWMIDIIESLADALESLSAPSGEDREALIDSTAKVLCQRELRGQNRSLDEVVAPGRALWQRYLYEAESLLDDLAHAGISLPEPAEVEWGTRWSGYTDNRGFMPAHSRESAEAVLEEFEGHEVIYRTPAGPWVPVKGTEQ